MSSIEKRAWLMLGSMFPAYVVYFALQALATQHLLTMASRLSLLAMCATAHALMYGFGLALIKRGERGDGLLQDERDRTIDARATRAAYFVLCTGMILVGVIMPFGNSGWAIVNAALFFIVLTEALRHTLIVLGYRGAARFAH